MTAALCSVCKVNPPNPAWTDGVCDDCIAELNRVDCEEQGVPEFIEDPAVLARVATVANAVQRRGEVA